MTDCCNQYFVHHDGQAWQVVPVFSQLVGVRQDGSEYSLVVDSLVKLGYRAPESDPLPEDYGKNLDREALWRAIGLFHFRDEWLLFAVLDCILFGHKPGKVARAYGLRVGTLRTRCSQVRAAILADEK